MKQKIDKYIENKGRKDKAEVITPTPTAQKIIDHLPEDVFISDSTTFLDPCFGTGTFLKVLALKLRQYGHSKENINSRLFGIETNRLYISLMKRVAAQSGFKPTIVHADALKYDFKDMKFDVVIGNPPFNTKSTGQSDNKNNTSRTAGNKTLYKQFTIMGFDRLKPNGKLAFVTLKGIYKFFRTDKTLSQYQIDSVDFMLGNDLWGYNTCWFVASNTSRTTSPPFTNSILKKVFSYDDKWKAVSRIISRPNIQSQYRTSNVPQEGYTKAIFKLPTLKNPMEYIYVDEAHKTLYDKGVTKFLCCYMTSKSSFSISTLPVLSPNTTYVNFETTEEAEGMKNLLSSKLAKYLSTSLNFTRDESDLLKFLKQIPLTQDLSTDELVYQAYNLTQEEIDLIESTVK